MTDLRWGFTTGSCAAAASKAAAYMLLSGMDKKNISIITPKGTVFDARIVDTVKSEKEVSCAVIKDGGDDPDVTTGAHIVATVSMADEKEGIVIDGGAGVGRVTQGGLDQPVGAAAINHVPREMILKEITEVLELFDYKGGLNVLISVPEGVALADKTFNSRLGIVGGISILGTSGVVEPMSEKAIIDTIRVELSQRRITAGDTIIISPGNYGQAFMKEKYNYDLDKSVKCSNYIGITLDIIRELGFKRVLLTGHIGKLVKLSGGIMNTHSKEADSRMELMASAAILAGADKQLLVEILKCVNTEQAVYILENAKLLDKTMKVIMEKAMYYLRKRAGEDITVECIMYSSEYGLLAESENAESILGESI